MGTNWRFLYSNEPGKPTPDAPEVDALLARVTDGAPVADVTADTGVRHSVWKIEDKAALDRLTQAFDAMPAL